MRDGYGFNEGEMAELVDQGFFPLDGGILKLH